MAHMNGMWMDMMWWIWIPSVIVLGPLIALGVWTVRRFSEPRGSREVRRVLEERFARGEIDATVLALDLEHHPQLRGKHDRTPVGLRQSSPTSLDHRP